jgi:ABC-type uncharacterized transport system substrate-binding protein
MARRFWVLALAAAVVLAWSLQASASGVYIVSRKGVDVYGDATAGFMQMAYSLQIPGFNAKAVELDGTAGDDAALANLKGQSPSLVFAVGAYAAKKVRQAMPDVWIVYGMVYYPEAEGFTGDAKMVGVSSLGPTKSLAANLKPIIKGKTLVVLYSRTIEAAIPGLVDRLKGDGLDAQAKPVADATGLQAAFDAVKDQCRAILLLPDPITSNPDALRFLVSQCVNAGIAPVSLSEPLVAGGVLLASFYPPDSVGNRAARVAAEILSTGKAPDERVVSPPDSATAVNKGTAQALRINFPKNFRPEVSYE